MKIDINRRTFALANKTGGMSGPAVKPVAVRMAVSYTHLDVYKRQVLNTTYNGKEDDIIEL